MRFIKDPIFGLEEVLELFSIQAYASKGFHAKSCMVGTKV